MIMTLMMRTWLAFTFAINRVAEGTCGESEKKRNSTVVKVKRKKREMQWILLLWKWKCMINILNITVVTITVVDTVWSKFTRGARAATIFPCNTILTVTEPLFRFCRRNVLQRKVLVRLMWEKLKWVRLRLKQNLAVLVALRSWYRVFFFNWYPPKKLNYGKPRLGESTAT